MILPYVAVLVGIYMFSSAWAAILIYHAGIVIFLLALKRDRERPRVFRGWSIPAGLTVSIICACAGPLLVLLWPFIARDSGGTQPFVDIRTFLGSMGLGGISWYAFMAYFATAQPLLEERFWREMHFSQGRSVSLGDAAFAGYHLLTLRLFLDPWWAAIATVLLMITGWVWRRLVIRHGGVAIPVVAHVAANISIMLAGLYLS